MAAILCHPWTALDHSSVSQLSPMHPQLLMKISGENFADKYSHLLILRQLVPGCPGNRFAVFKCINTPNFIPLQPGIECGPVDILDLSRGGFPSGITGKAFLACFQKLPGPAVVNIGVDALAAA